MLENQNQMLVALSVLKVKHEEKRKTKDQKINTKLEGTKTKETRKKTSCQIVMNTGGKISWLNCEWNRQKSRLPILFTSPSL